MAEKDKNIEELQGKLITLLNAHSIENGSDTPDFLLAEYLIRCLEIWNKIVRERDKWHGHESLAERLAREAQSQRDPLSL